MGTPKHVDMDVEKFLAGNFKMADFIYLGHSVSQITSHNYFRTMIATDNWFFSVIITLLFLIRLN